MSLHLQELKTRLTSPQAKLIIGLIFIASLIGLYLYLIQTKPSTEIPQTSSLDRTKANYQQLQPGQATHQDILNQLGAPDQTYKQGDYLIYTYPSTTSQFQPDLLYTRNDTVVLKELHFSPLQYNYPTSELTDLYGQPDHRLYQPYSPIDQVAVYFYPNRGLAAFISQSKDQVFKIQQFPPITLETYLENWGKGLLQAQPTPTNINIYHPEE